MLCQNRDAILISADMFLQPHKQGDALSSPQLPHFLPFSVSHSGLLKFYGVTARTEQSREIWRENKTLAKMVFLRPGCHLRDVWLNLTFTGISIILKICYFAQSPDIY